MIHVVEEHTRKVLALLTPRIVDRIYTRETITADILAGVTSAAILIPNAMAYALLAGLSPITGLYAALPAVLLAGIWGSSSFVVTGPVGIVSLLTLTSLIPFAEAGSAEFITLAIALAALAGIFQLGMGLLRLGFLAQLIPHSVIVGFSAAAALIIGMVQIPSLLGFSVVQKEHVIETLFSIVQSLSHVHVPTALLGVLLLLVLFLGKRKFPQLPVALIVLFVTLISSSLFDFESFGIQTIGAVPAGLPSFSFSAFSIPTFLVIAQKALIIAIVGFIETYSIAKSLAHTNSEKISADKELVGQGLANIGASIAGGYPVSGSFSVSALNKSAGARTELTSVVITGVILIVLVAIAPILSALPKVALAAIVVSAIVPLITVSKLYNLYQLTRYDGIIAATTFGLSLLLKPDDAIIIGIVIALVLLVHRVMWADVKEVGIHRTWGTLHRSDEADVETYPHILMVRIDASFVYANTERITEQIEDLCEKHNRCGDTVRMLICNFSGVNTIDASGIEGFEEIMHCARGRGIDLAVVNVKSQIRSVFERAGIMKKIIYFHNTEELKEYCNNASLPVTIQS